jgi:hypothetical protein
MLEMWRSLHVLLTHEEMQLMASAAGVYEGVGILLSADKDG